MDRAVSNNGMLFPRHPSEKYRHARRVTPDFGIVGGAADPVFVPFRTISKPHFAHRLDCPAANVRVDVAHDGFIADEACTSPFYRLEATNRANTLKICKPNSRPFLC
jgi:hypothetical protein